jgi:hypothetical protein
VSEITANAVGRDKSSRENSAARTATATSWMWAMFVGTALRIPMYTATIALQSNAEPVAIPMPPASLPENINEASATEYPMPSSPAINPSAATPTRSLVVDAARVGRGAFDEWSPGAGGAAAGGSVWGAGNMEQRHWREPILVSLRREPLPVAQAFRCWYRLQIRH